MLDSEVISHAACNRYLMVPVVGSTGLFRHEIWAHLCSQFEEKPFKKCRRIGVNERPSLFQGSRWQKLNLVIDAEQVDYQFIAFPLSMESGARQEGVSDSRQPARASQQAGQGLGRGASGQNCVVLSAQLQARSSTRKNVSMPISNRRIIRRCRCAPRPS